MPPSQHFNNLVTSHRILVSTYLPNVTAIGIPTAQEQEMTRAYIALAHAEIEFYFESICEDILHYAESEFKAGRVTTAALGLITFSALPAINAGDSIMPDKKGSFRKVSERFYTATSNYRKDLADSHGIRQKYLAPLLTPLGLTQESIDPNWVVLMDAFAAKRGAVAHKSMTHIEAQSKNINPADEADRVKRIIFDDPKLKAAGTISSIESFDAWAINYIASPNNRVLIGHQRHNGIMKRLLWWIIEFFDRWR